MAAAIMEVREMLEHAPTHVPDAIDTFNLVAQKLEALDHAEMESPPEGLKEFAGPRFSLPQGAAECSTANVMDFGMSSYITAGTQFTTLISNLCVGHGKWMYEVVLDTDGLFQIGWSTAKQLILWSSKKGVGDFPHTVGYDGFRKQLWAVEGRPCGWRWTIGDVVSCCFDADVGEVSFYQNGEFVAVHPLPTVGSLTAAGVCTSNYDSNLLYFPAMSIAAGQRCDVNFGAVPFQYPKAGFNRMVSTGVSWARRIECLLKAPLPDPLHMQLFGTIVLRTLNEESGHLNTFLTSIMSVYQKYEGCEENNVGVLFRLFKECLAPQVFDAVTQLFIAGMACYSSLRPIHKLLVDKPTPSRALQSIHILITTLPAASAAWVRSPLLDCDLVSALWLKTPNNQDLTLMFPDSMASAVYSLNPEVVAAAKTSISSRIKLLVEDCVKPDNARRIDLVCMLLNDEHGCKALTHLLEIAIKGDQPASTRRLDGAIVTRLLSSVIGALKRCGFGGPSSTVAPDCVLANESDTDRVGGTFEFVSRSTPLSFSTAAASPRIKIVYLVCALYEKVARDFISEGCASVATQQTLTAQLETAMRNGEDRASSLKEELTKIARPVGWNLITLFRALDYSALMGFASHVASHLIHLLDRDPLRLSYVPVVMLKCVAGIVHFSRKTSPHYTELLQSNPSAVSFFFKFFRAPEIRHGETAEFMMHTLAGIIDVYPDNRDVVANIVDRHRQHFTTKFFPRLVTQLNHEMAWTVAANAMFRLSVGSAFAAVLDEDTPEWIKVFGLTQPTTSRLQPIYGELLREFVATGDVAGQKATPSALVKDLLVHANWCLSELSVGLAHPSATDSNPDDTAITFRRRLVSVFDFARKLMHFLEMILQHGFELFAPSSTTRALNSATAVSMVCELIVQCLVRFCDKRSPLHLIEVSPPVGLERLTVSSFAAPVLGCTLHMFPDISDEGLSANPFAAHFRNPRNEFHFETWWRVLTLPWQQICQDVKYGGTGLSRIHELKVVLSQIELSRELVGDTQSDPGDEEALCHICCQNEMDVSFVPCGHRCCEGCARRHLVLSTTCFFCKHPIASLKNIPHNK